MANRSKQRGTRAESAVVAYLIERGWLHAERRTLSGAFDKGDIAGVVGINGAVCAEIKDCKTMTLGPWLVEAEVEKANAKAKVGVVWHKRRGHSSPASWFVTMSGEQFCDLLIDAGYGTQAAAWDGNPDRL